MILVDLGADVVRVDRPGRSVGVVDAAMLRNRRSVVADLTSHEGRNLLLHLVAEAGNNLRFRDCAAMTMDASHVRRATHALPGLPVRSGGG